MDALSAGTPEAMNQFLQSYPNSALPGSELGASIAAGLDSPTAATSAGAAGAAQGGTADDGVY